MIETLGVSLQESVSENDGANIELKMHRTKVFFSLQMMIKKLLRFDRRKRTLCATNDWKSVIYKGQGKKHDYSTILLQAKSKRLDGKFRLVWKITNCQWYRLRRIVKLSLIPKAKWFCSERVCNATWVKKTVAVPFLLSYTSLSLDPWLHIRMAGGVMWPVDKYIKGLSLKKQSLRSLHASRLCAIALKHTIL